jgi:hypothetical protein
MIMFGSFPPEPWLVWQSPKSTRVDGGRRCYGINEVTTGFGVGLRGTKPENPKSPLACEPFREFIELGLSRGRNAMAIWQDLLAETGFRDGYGTVKRFVRKLRGHQPPEARAVIVTAPGEEAQVDYGTGPMVRDPQSGKYRRTRLFVDDAGLQPQGRTPADVSLQFAYLGRAA